MSRAISVRFDERLAERTRVARELHDTFLQTVQGSKLVADLALKTPDDNARMVRAMEQLSAWLGRAAEEGRAALNSLRASITERNNLADALRRALDECRGEKPAEVSVTGESREIHPVVRDEIYRIAYEAIRNACAHSGAKGAIPDPPVIQEYRRHHRPVDHASRVWCNGLVCNCDVNIHAGFGDRSNPMNARMTFFARLGGGLREGEQLLCVPQSSALQAVSR